MISVLRLPDMIVVRNLGEVYNISLSYSVKKLDKKERQHGGTITNTMKEKMKRHKEKTVSEVSLSTP
jgi:hypothetical protein